MFKEVFISHAKEDYEVAERIYNYLEQNSYSPWLDKKKIRVGSNWDFEIKRALKESTFVILVLSSISVKKRGYVQREFKYAVEYSEKKLIDDIYIIPILIDKCEVPEHLNQFQWIEMDDDNILENVLESLNYQRQKYLNDLPQEQIEINDYSTFSVDLNLDFYLKVDYDCNLPLFHENRFFDANFVNTFIQQKSLKFISDLRALLSENREHYQENENLLYLEISHSIKKLDEENLSMSIIYNTYLGGAHPNTNVDTLNFTFKPERLMEFEELVGYNNFQDYLIEVIEKFGNKEQRESLKNYAEYVSKESINFVFNDDVIEIDFTNEIPRILLALGTLEIPRK
jgi:hypothetical protein